MSKARATRVQEGDARPKEHLLSIDVECLAGTDIHDACEGMVNLANKLGCSVQSHMNGVTVVARPGVDHKALYSAWENERDSKRAYKLAIV